MSRLAKILALSTAVVAVAAITAACGSQKISVPRSQSQVYRGATLFNQRCSGCHTLSYAATYGSAPNVRTAQAISGPNFNQRCERPIDRVLYAIENGGFSGAYMPQNVVVGQDAIDVAKFVATYAGRQAPIQSGVVKCQNRAIGTLPPGSGTTQIASGTSSSSSSTTSALPPTSKTSGKNQGGTGASASHSSGTGGAAKSGTAKSGTTKSGTTQSGTTKSGTTKTGKTKTGKATGSGTSTSGA
ncbi:MAG TPA: c-type cytochrome [Solirubrobacteraceae bacterium]|jgi:mono/diheme cytochrome c family protein|nr:c-type cytochrome [Solirubrobacteraceae bacterium]